MENDPLYTAEMTLLKYKHSLSAISEKLHYLGGAIWEGMNEEAASKEVLELSREANKLAKSINLSITE